MQDVADVLGTEPEAITRALQLPQTRAEMFPDAEQHGDTWHIPAAAVRRLLGPREERLYPVKAFAQLIGFSAGHVYALIQRGLIKTRPIFGETRVPASQYYALPAHKPAPDPAKAPPPFFLREEAQNRP